MLRENFIKLPWPLKLIGIGSLGLLISTFLPWYSDIDAYRIGDRFLGLTGPTSLVGFVILLMAGLSFLIFLFRLLDKRPLKLPVKESIYQLFAGGESLFLLILVNSIFYHHKFGVNITVKETGFGMVLAFLSGLCLTAGAYLFYKKELSTEKEIGKLEPLISFEPKREHRASVGTVTESVRSNLAPRVHAGVQPQEKLRLSEPPEEQKLKPQEKLRLEQKPKSESPEQSLEKSGGGSYIIRTDL